MKYIDKKFVTLDQLVGELGLPREYLKKLAADNSIPSLDVSGNGRLRFNPEAVQLVLDRIAMNGGGDGQG